VCARVCVGRCCSTYFPSVRRSVCVPGVFVRSSVRAVRAWEQIGSGRRRANSKTLLQATGRPSSCGIVVLWYVWYVWYVKAVGSRKWRRTRQRKEKEEGEGGSGQEGNRKEKKSPPESQHISRNGRDGGLTSGLLYIERNSECRCSRYFPAACVRAMGHMWRESAVSSGMGRRRRRRRRGRRLNERGGRLPLFGPPFVHSHSSNAACAIDVSDSPSLPLGGSEQLRAIWLRRLWNWSSAR